MRFILILLLVACAARANATTINIVETVSALEWTTDDPPLSQSYLVGVGDTIFLDVSFADNKSLKLTSLAGFSDIAFNLRRPGNGFFTINSINLLLKDFVTNGDGSNRLSRLTYTSGTAQIGPLFSDAQLGVEDGEFFQFSGFELRYVIEALDPIEVTTTSFLSRVINWEKEIVETPDVPPIAPIPLPAAIWLFVTALGLLAFRVRMPSLGSSNQK